MVDPRHPLIPGLNKLDRKLVRDLWSMRVQIIAIALVIAAGVAVHIVAAGMLDSLKLTRDTYYDRHQFADIWAPVVRAPEALAGDAGAIPGVRAVESRVRSAAQFSLDTMDAPAAGEVLSLPQANGTAINRIFLVEGRMPLAGQRDEILLLETFALAHGLEPGDTIEATIYGARDRLRITGLALSPEYVYAIAPGQIVPDPRMFGVAWMEREALAQAVDRDGAFTELVVQLQPGAEAAPVIAALDRLLEPYGAPGAYAREDQISDAFVSSEIDQLSTMAGFLPPIFLAVAAVLVNVVLARLVALERTEIGLLKAFGYRDRDVVIHYLKFASVIGAIGFIAGLALGVWLGRSLAALYTEYYRFPYLIFSLRPEVYGVAALVTFTAIGGAGILAAWSAARLDPAIAMRPPPPPDYSQALGAGLTRWKRIDHQTRMILRQILRWPQRSAITIGGIAVSAGLLISTLFFLDSMEVMIGSYFDVANRQDITVSFNQPRSREALYALERMPGVMAAEPVRHVAVRLRNGPVEERAALTGLPREAQLSRAVTAAGVGIEPPPGGLVLSQDLAQRLGVSAGETIEVEVTEGRRPVLEIPVSGVSTSYIGSSLNMQIDDLNRIMGEGRVITGAALRIDRDQEARLYSALKAAPGVAGLSLQTQAEEMFIDIMDQSLGTSIFIYTLFAGLIAVGVVYNSVRISFSERETELAVLRVLGFTRGEVAYVLLGEIAVLTLIALPVGALAGAGLAFVFAEAMSSDLFRLPYVIEARTFAYAAGVVIFVAISSALMVRSRLDKLDMVAVLKAGE